MLTFASRSRPLKAAKSSMDALISAVMDLSCRVVSRSLTEYFPSLPMSFAEIASGPISGRSCPASGEKTATLSVFSLMLTSRSNVGAKGPAVPRIASFASPKYPSKLTGAGWLSTKNSALSKPPDNASGMLLNLPARSMASLLSTGSMISFSWSIVIRSPLFPSI